MHTTKLYQMKKFIIFIFINIFLLICAFAQNGIEDQTYSTISKAQSSLSNVTGWSLQDNGKFAAAKNKIPYSDYHTNKRPSSRRKLGVENFTEMQLKKVFIDHIQYNVLVLIYKDGTYEFPILAEGWEPFKSVEYFVFKSHNLSKILPHIVPFNSAYAVDVDVYCAGEIRDYDPLILDQMIVRNIQSTSTMATFNTTNLIFAVKPIRDQEKEVVHFKLIRSSAKKSLSAWYLDPQNAESLFNKSYYETKFYRFKKFIRDSEVYNLPTTNTPYDFKSFYNWGVLKYQAGNYEDAIIDFNTALSYNVDTNFSMVYSYRGIAKSKLNNHNGAIEDFDRAIDIQPKDVMHYPNWIKNYFNRGVSKFYTNDIEGACEDWNRAFEFGFGGALEYLEKYCN